MVTAAGVSTVGSTFLPSAPDAEALAERLVAHGARFVPALTGAVIVRSRVCARPQSIDGRPFIGPLDAIDGVFVTAGHGPWGISTGPASAALAVGAILDGSLVPEALRAMRSI
jgi:glycine/D-amino acid oxidase-like deaminating enzyme